MISKKTFYTIIYSVLGVVVLVNILSWFFYLRFDFTADGQYTLSDATKKTLGELKQPVTVTAWISKDLPPDIDKTKEDFRDILSEYSNLAGANFIYKIEDPGDGQQATQEGITPAILDVREKDQVKQQRIYLGAVVKYGTQKEVIPLIQPGTSMEFALTTAIKKMSATGKSTVGYLQGHGEPSFQAIAQLMQALTVTMDVVPVNFSDSLAIPSQVKTILIVAPKDTFPASHLEMLEKFAASGGKIVAALNTTSFNQQSGEVTKLATGLEDFFKDKGISIKHDLVFDYSCASIMVSQQSAGVVFQTPVKFPLFPVITTFAPISPLKGLEGVTMMFPASIDTIAGKGFRFTPLAVTSDRTGLEQVPMKVDLNREWSAAEFRISKVIVAVLAESVKGSQGGKFLVISDGDLVVNGEGNEAQNLQADNINLVANMVEFLTDDSGLAQLRNKNVTQRPIDPAIGDGAKVIIKYLNFLAPVILSIMFGLYRYSKRKTLRETLEDESWTSVDDEEKE